MLKLMPWVAAALIAFAAPAGAADAALGPDAASCRAGAEGPALLVSIHGFKNRAGNLRVQLYPGNPDAFLVKHRWVRRIDLPVTGAGPMRVCVAVPRPGDYAVAVRHDADGNGKSGWDDGGGFSRNPAISLFHLRPDYRSVAIRVGTGVRPLDIVLNYRRGLSIGPVAGS